MTPRIVLASASPRRTELLRAILPEFDVIPSGIEESMDGASGPVDLVISLASAKAEDVAVGCRDCVIIGADTLVVVDDHTLGKPEDAGDARRMLRLLSGRTHSVITGVSVVYRGETTTSAEVTEVLFSTMTEGQIEAYTQTGEPLDKAGAYGIQGRASIFIQGIKGCYFNVVGLPLFRLNQLLADRGIHTEALW